VQLCQSACLLKRTMSISEIDATPCLNWLNGRYRTRTCDPLRVKADVLGDINRRKRQDQKTLTTQTSDATVFRGFTNIIGIFRVFAPLLCRGRESCVYETSFPSKRLVQSQQGFQLSSVLTRQNVLARTRGCVACPFARLFAPHRGGGDDDLGSRFIAGRASHTRTE
jgi:hypothetical protein